jgi:molecular chaperone Hsp33
VSDDFLQKFLFENVPVKGSLVRLDASWKEILTRSQPSESTRDLLGETLCASVLLTSNIKFQGSVSLQVQSAGNLRFLLGQCNHRGELRGVVRMREQPVPEFLKQAILAINLEPERDGTPYQGIVEMNEEGLAGALERYFSQSEQLDTRFWLAAGPSHCSGLMLQRMPGESADADGWNRIKLLASTMAQDELQTLDSRRLISMLFREEDVRLFTASEVRFKCSCSSQKVSSMLQTLGEDDLNDLIKERGVVEVCCEYCGRAYQFDQVDVARIFSETIIPIPESKGLH